MSKNILLPLPNLLGTMCMLRVDHRVNGQTYTQEGEWLNGTMQCPMTRSYRSPPPIAESTETSLNACVAFDWMSLGGSWFRIADLTKLGRRTSPIGAPMLPQWSFSASSSLITTRGW